MSGGSKRCSAQTLKEQTLVNLVGSGEPTKKMLLRLDGRRLLRGDEHLLPIGLEVLPLETIGMAFSYNGEHSITFETATQLRGDRFLAVRPGSPGTPAARRLQPGRRTEGARFVDRRRLWDSAGGALRNVNRLARIHERGGERGFSEP